MWHLEKMHCLPLTKRLANTFATMNPCPNDRPLSERRVAIYRNIVERGEFRSCTWAWVSKCNETGEEFRVNGKHTATLFSQMETLPEISITVERYTCDTIADVVRLYSTFDSGSATRTTCDINRSFAAINPDLAIIPSRVINLCASGIAYFTWRTAYGQIPAGERAEKLLDHVPFCMWVSELLTSGKSEDRKILARGPVVAAMHATYLRSQKDSRVFWESVRDDTGASPDLPDRRLAKWLRVMSVQSGQGGRKPGSRMAQPKEFYVKCLHAWNAFRNGETTDLKYYREAKLPLAR